MPSWVEHGAGVCGMTHIHNFGSHKDYTSRQWASFISEQIGDKMSEIEEEYWDDDIDEYVNEEKTPHLFEIVLSDSQLMQAPTLVGALKTLDFKLVTRFLNGNSGNILNVFHLVHGEKGISTTPFKWSY